MSPPSARIRGLFVFLALVSWSCPNTAGAAPAPPFILIPAQLAMGVPPGLAGPPPERRAITAPVHPVPRLSAPQNSRLAQVLSQFTPKDRKRLVKAIKRMSPEQRTQFAVMLQRRLSGR